MTDFGIRVTIVEPGAFATDWGGSSAKRSQTDPAYDGVREKAAEMRAKRVSSSGQPAASSAALLAVVDAEQPPLRIFLGEGPLGIATADYESRLATWREWQPVSVAAGGVGA